MRGKKKKNLRNLKNCQNNLWGDIFASRPRARPVGALGIFACPTLERLPPSFYLIRDEPMVEEYHSFGYLTKLEYMNITTTKKKALIMKFIIYIC